MSSPLFSLDDQVRERLVVQKYGGTSVGTPDRIKAVAENIAATVKRGHSVVVVVSAMGSSTDELVDLADKISSRNHDGYLSRKSKNSRGPSKTIM